MEAVRTPPTAGTYPKVVCIAQLPVEVAIPGAAEVSVSNSQPTEPAGCRRGFGGPVKETVLPRRFHQARSPTTPVAT